jgi:hypothetical protein
MRKQPDSREFEVGPAEAGLKESLLVGLSGQFGVDLGVEVVEVL